MIGVSSRHFLEGNAPSLPRAGGALGTWQRRARQFLAAAARATIKSRDKPARNDDP